MMPTGHDSIFSICKVCPNAIGQKLILATQGHPTMSSMRTPYFLQKNNIRMQLADKLALLVQHQARIKTTDTFMDIERGDM